MARPGFCPNCGKLLPLGPHGAQPFSADEAGIEGRGWDCYCKSCKWSGDIMPDNEDHAEVEHKKEGAHAS
mgnify:CR=1 FL=1